MEDVNTYYKIFVDDMVLILSKKSESVNICIEIFLLLSYLTGQEEVFKRILESSKDFMVILQKIISLYSVYSLYLLFSRKMKWSVSLFLNVLPSYL